MTIDNHMRGLEESISIDAAPADIFAVLTAVEPVLAESTGLTVSTGVEDVTVTDAGAEGAYPSVFGGKVRVTDSEEPTSLTMTFEGDIQVDVEWTIQAQKNSTLVTATVTVSQVSIDHQEGIESQLTATLDDVLTTLQTLCEQPSPPASMAARIEIPEIYCPFPDEINPHAEEVRAQSQEWAQELGMIDEPSQRIDTVSLLGCQLHPQASLESMQLCSDWYSWVFAHDDDLDPTELGTNPEAVESFHEPLLAGLIEDSCGSHPEPRVKGFIDIFQRASNQMPEELYTRFVEHHRDYFDGLRGEAHNRATNHIPDYHVFLPNRRRAAGVYPLLDLGELSSNICVPEDAYHSEMVIALCISGGNAIALTNDVYSLHKELADGEVNNLAVVIRNEQGCSLQEAVNEACQLVGTEIRRFETLSQHITGASDTTEALSAYITAIELSISGHLAWSKETARYKTVD